ncbi:MAG TPA: shikimate kinase [Chloroflexota bacterium]
MNIYLAGLIGTGKTTLGSALARHLGWRFEDLDAAMEQQAGKGFRQVVADEGWLGFREREYSLCKGFGAMNRTVVALGGGTVRYEWNRDIIRGTGVNVLLTANLAEIAERVRPQDRPRVNQGSTLEEDLAMIWSRHQDSYLNWADVVYPTDQGRAIPEEVEDLLAVLQGTAWTLPRDDPRD